MPKPIVRAKNPDSRASSAARKSSKVVEENLLQKMLDGPQFKSKTKRKTDEFEVLYPLGDIYAYWVGFWYEAKIIQIDEAGHPNNDEKMVPCYLVHYSGYSSKYDEWVMSDSLMAYTEANGLVAAMDNEKAHLKCHPKKLGQNKQEVTGSSDATAKPARKEASGNRNSASEVAKSLSKKSSNSSNKPSSHTLGTVMKPLSGVPRKSRGGPAPAKDPASARPCSSRTVSSFRSTKTSVVASVCQPKSQSKPSIGKSPAKPGVLCSGPRKIPPLSSSRSRRARSEDSISPGPPAKRIPVSKSEKSRVVIDFFTGKKPAQPSPSPASLPIIKLQRIPSSEKFNSSLQTPPESRIPVSVPSSRPRATGCYVTKRPSFKGTGSGKRSCSGGKGVNLDGIKAKKAAMVDSEVRVKIEEVDGDEKWNLSETRGRGQSERSVAAADFWMTAELRPVAQVPDLKGQPFLPTFSQFALRGISLLTLPTIQRLGVHRQVIVPFGFSNFRDMMKSATATTRILVRFCRYPSTESPAVECHPKDLRLTLNDEHYLVETHLPLPPVAAARTDARFVAAVEFDVGMLKEKNKLCIEWTDGSVVGEPIQDFLLFIERAERQSALDAMANVRSREIIMDVSIGKLYSLLTTRDAEGKGGSLIFSLRCPLSKQRLVDPVRGKNCPHVECFDGETYMMNNILKRPQWICPICFKPALLDDLIVDQYVRLLLEFTEHDRVLVLSQAHSRDLVVRELTTPSTTDSPNPSAAASSYPKPSPLMDEIPVEVLVGLPNN